MCSRVATSVRRRWRTTVKRLTATWREQQVDAAKLDTAIAANLKELGYGD
jgi:hypothetical protein